MIATEAIVLKKLDIGEADVLYALYTRDFGKVVARAQGIRKIEAKLRGHLEPLSRSAVRLIQGRAGDKLIGAVLRRYGERMRSREVTLRLAAYTAARIDERCFAGERDDALWQLAVASFETLDARDFPEHREADFRREFDEGLLRCLGEAVSGGQQSADGV